MKMKSGHRERWLDTVLRSLSEAVILADPEGRVTLMNPAAEALAGWRQAEAAARPLREVFAVRRETDNGKALDLLGETLDPGGEPWEGTLLLAAKDGSRIRIGCGVSAARDEKGDLSGIVISFHALESNLLDRMAEGGSGNFLDTIFDSIHDPFCIFDEELRVVRANEAYARIKSMPVEDLIGKKCLREFNGVEIPCDVCVVASTFRSSEPSSMESHVASEGGMNEWFEIFTYPIRNHAGATQYVVEYSRDITGRKLAEEERKRLIRELQHLSRVDSLTGLRNRRALMDALDQEVQRSRRYGTDLSLLLCDIDYFKEINDTFGHAAGDSALALVAGVFKKLARRTDVAGRYGGDEFMLLMPETPIEGAREFADRILKAVRKLAFSPNPSEKVGMTISVGISVFDPDKDNADTLISRADNAMYSSKRRGRDRVTAVLP